MGTKKVYGQLDSNIAEDVASNLQELRPGETLIVKVTKRKDSDTFDTETQSPRPDEKIAGGERSEFLLTRLIKRERE